MNEDDEQVEEQIDDDANLLAEEHIKIFDPETEEVFFTGRG